MSALEVVTERIGELRFKIDEIESNLKRADEFSVIELEIMEYRLELLGERLLESERLRMVIRDYH